jgi:hypothetical protein
MSARKQMRRIQPLNPEFTGFHDLTVAEDTRLSISDVVHRQHCEKATA